MHRSPGKPCLLCAIGRHPSVGPSRLGHNASLAHHLLGPIPSFIFMHFLQTPTEWLLCPLNKTHRAPGSGERIL